MAQVISFSPAPSFFGFGALQKLPEVMRARGFGRVLVFTDSLIARSGILERVVGLLKGSVDQGDPRVIREPGPKIVLDDAQGRG